MGVPVPAKRRGELGAPLVGEEQASPVDLGTRIGAQAAEALGDETDPVAALRVGCLTWIRLARDPVVRQIMLIDAPAVLGWHRWREIDDQGPLGTFRAVLAYAAEQGRVDPRHVDTFAHIVLAAANEAALMVALADDPAATLADVEDAFSEFLDASLAPPSARSSLTGRAGAGRSGD